VLRRSLVIALALLALLGVAAPVARADRLTRGEEQLHQELGQLCRYPTDASRSCDALDGYHLDEAQVQAYEAGWIHHAIGLQRALDEDVPLKDALFPHTHNSFNSEAYTPTLSRMDHNQLLSITDQLRLDMRAIEIDVHRSVSATEGTIGVVACHANEQVIGPQHVHVGCTTEEPLLPYLQEVAAWLKQPGNDELVILYLENHLENDPAALDIAVENITSALGDLVITTAETGSGACGAMPYDASRSALRPNGRVLIVGDCSDGDWGTYVHNRFPRWDESSNPAGDDYVCAADRADAAAHDRPYDSFVTRRYEDRTWLTAMAETEGGITAAEMAAMVACGVNLVGFDMLHPDDPRLATLVWSWAPGQPATGGCALQRADGRFVSAPCTQKHRVACFDGTSWSASRKAVRFDRAADACAASASSFDVPWNGWENGRLLTAAGGGVWLAYAGTAGDWHKISSH
jgi:hypothetical protein